MEISESTPGVLPKSLKCPYILCYLPGMPFILLFAMIDRNIHIMKLFDEHQELLLVPTHAATLRENPSFFYVPLLGSYLTSEDDNKI